MAAGVRSDRRIARIRDLCPKAGPRARTTAPDTRHERRRRTLQPKDGRVDLYLSQLAKTDIMVALTGRGRGQLHRLRGMSTGIRAPVHERADASAVTF
jgi:hypothetical protein